MRSFLNLLLAVPAALAAPLLRDVSGAEAIAGSWIVRINEDAALPTVLSQVLGLSGVNATHTYDIGSFKGFSIDGIADALSVLGSLTSIAEIEPNTKVYASALTTQANAPWGLGRISHRNPGATSYIYDDSAGAGTYAYIIDTGIYTEHNDFEGRAVFGASFVDGEGAGDGNGHGTHVAGTTGSKTYGVAKKTNLIAVKVLGAEGSGSNAGVLAGIAWAVNDAKSKGRIGKAVANLSLGSIIPDSMSNQGAAAAVAQGLFLAVAAGNGLPLVGVGVPAETTSPGGEPTVCTVSATDKNDNRATFANFGGVVDIFAPGVDVISTWKDGPDDTNTISGTSMATPHITGLGAYILGLEGPRTPDALCERLKTLSTKGKVKLALSANNLAYNNNGA